MANAYTNNAIKSFTVTGKDPGDDPSLNRDLWLQIQSEINKNTMRDTMLAAMGFAIADLDIGEPFTSRCRLSHRVMVTCKQPMTL